MSKVSVVIPVINAEKYMKEYKKYFSFESFEDVELIFADSAPDNFENSCRSALDELKKELQSRNIFNKFEKDYVNLALNLLVSVLNSADNRENYIKFADDLKNKYFFDFGIAGHTRGYFYSSYDFDVLLDIIDKSGDDLWCKYKETASNTDYPLFDIDNWQNDTPVPSDGSIKISVVVPVYNAEEFVEECVNSIRNNTLKDIEIICINDGSTDNSLAVLNFLKEQDSRITVADKPNSGPSDTRNMGIELARGEYISFIDSDDYIHPKTYELLYTKAKQNNLDQLYFSAKSFFESDNMYSAFSDFDELYRRRADYSEITSGRQMFKKMSGNAEFRPSPCMLISRREFLSKNNLRFKEGILHEDNLFIIQCLTFAERVSYVNANLYFRRMRRNSIMTGENNIKRVFSYYEIIKILGSFAKNENLNCDKEFFDALKRQISLMNYNACEVAEKIPPEELDAFSDTLKEDDAINFYNYINTVSRALSKKKEGQTRFINSKETEKVVQYKLNHTNDNLKKDVLRLENENNSLLSKRIVRFALKLDSFIAKIKRIFK